MMEELLVPHRARLQLLLQERAQFVRLVLLRLGRGAVLERSLKLGPLRSLSSSSTQAVHFSSNVFINIPQQILQFFPRIKQARHDRADGAA